MHRSTMHAPATFYIRVRVEAGRAVRECVALCHSRHGARAKGKDHATQHHDESKELPKIQRRTCKFSGARGANENIGRIPLFSGII